MDTYEMESWREIYPIALSDLNVTTGNGRKDRFTRQQIPVERNILIFHHTHTLSWTALDNSELILPTKKEIITWRIFTIVVRQYCVSLITRSYAMMSLDLSTNQLESSSSWYLEQTRWTRAIFSTSSVSLFCVQELYQTYDRTVR